MPVAAAAAAAVVAVVPAVAVLVPVLVVAVVPVIAQVAAVAVAVAVVLQGWHPPRKRDGWTPRIDTPNTLDRLTLPLLPYEVRVITALLSILAALLPIKLKQHTPSTHAISVTALLSIPTASLSIVSPPCTL